MTGHKILDIWFPLVHLVQKDIKQRPNLYSESTVTGGVSIYIVIIVGRNLGAINQEEYEALINYFQYRLDEIIPKLIP